ncbi:TetR/AcrR family transcriptional regulator [Glycomyces algeriensis]|uniref:TetR family transcriptional regulator n=1 Tax=Glycomyces algeriensis TaxID=256037 RepID=A0A9W6LIE9_9ACTN|nr:helix-turn-helix domain-containing protein [Glycomyces algeriensis]MDA1366620.1 helix-turn-helix domain containing protein [Glycomyces algeriensis]MDR7352277.1 AcrR family transcriptional regulator [Glycomyces algeriensis]GLI45012.1 TetR family transcriptional regulator [Glycomyces algeriensis]
MSIVKGTGKRAEKARLTRRKILAAAERLFIEHGYGATTVQDVADAAGVAVQTIYFSFGNKRTLMKELVDVAIAGDDEPVPTMQRQWFLDALAAPTATELLAGFTAGSADIQARLAPVLKIAETAAATDPELAEIWRSDTDPRYTVCTEAATALLTKPDAAQGIEPAHAADVLYGLTSPELYLVMVKSRHWTTDQWSRWTLETLRAQLCRSD